MPTSESISDVEMRVPAREGMIAWPSLLIVCILSLAFVLVRDDVLPSRFFSDSAQIQSIAQGRLDAYGDVSYGLVAGIYRGLGLADLPQVAAAASFVLYIAVVFIAVLRARVPLNARGTILAGISIVLGAIFLAAYTKDIFTAIVACLALVLPRGKIGEVALLAAMAGYGYTTRQYWLLIAVAYVYFRIIFRWCRRRLTLLGWCVLCIVALGVAVWLMNGVSADWYRVSVNASRMGDVDARTIVLPALQGPEPMSGIVNVLVAWFGFLIPWPLLKIGGIYYVAVALFLGLLTVLVVHAFGWVRRLYVPTGTQLERASAIILAFSCVQALFEPDFGSYLRHLVPIMPLIVYVTLRGSVFGTRAADGAQHAEFLKGIKV